MFFAIVALLLMAVVSVWALSRFAPVHTMPMYLVVPLVLSVFLPLSITILVPADLIGDSSGLSDRARLIMWRIVYWLSFVLTWAVLPSLQFYVESGHYDPMTRLKDALRSNIRYQLTLAAAGVIGLVYMGLSTGLTLSNLKALAIALSHSYALLIAVYLLGHGLVNVPKGVWEDEVDKRLKTLYLHANPTYDSYADAQSNYEDAVASIMALLPVKTQQYSDWIDDLVDDAQKLRPATTARPASRTALTPGDLNEDYLAKLSKRFYRDQHRAIRYRADWVKLLKDASFYEDIAKARDTGSDALTFRHYETRFSPANAQKYYVLARPYIIKATAVLMALSSLVIFQSEMLLGTRFSLVELLVRSTHGFVQVLVMVSLLGYVCAVTGSALASVRIFNLYALVHRETDPSSLLFYAMYACRLAIPLSFNFLMLNSGGHNTTVFQDFLGKFINLTPLGKYFNEILPRLIVIPMALTWFKLYDRVKDFLGFGLVDFEDDREATSSSADGRQLIQRALTDTRFRYSLEALQTSNSTDLDGAAQVSSTPGSVMGRMSSWFS